MGNRVDISIEGPIMENLARVVITDDIDTDTFHVDFADVEKARTEGKAALLELLDNNAGDGSAILSAAIENDTTVSLDGEDIEHSVLVAALGLPGDTRAYPAP